MKQHASSGVLKETAIAIGGAAGKLAALAKSVMPHEEKAAAPVAKRKAKLPAKKKARLPRKQKKMLASKKSA